MYEIGTELWPLSAQLSIGIACIYIPGSYRRYTSTCNVIIYYAHLFTGVKVVYFLVNFARDHCCVNFLQFF